MRKIDDDFRAFPIAPCYSFPISELCSLARFTKILLWLVVLLAYFSIPRVSQAYLWILNPGVLQEQCTSTRNSIFVNWALVLSIESIYHNFMWFCSKSEQWDDGASQNVGWASVYSFPAAIFVVSFMHDPLPVRMSLSLSVFVALPSKWATESQFIFLGCLWQGFGLILFLTVHGPLGHSRQTCIMYFVYILFNLNFKKSKYFEKTKYITNVFMLLVL